MPGVPCRRVRLILGVSQRRKATHLREERLPLLSPWRNRLSPWRDRLSPWRDRRGRNTRATAKRLPIGPGLDLAAKVQETSLQKRRASQLEIARVEMQ